MIKINYFVLFYYAKILKWPLAVFATRLSLEHFLILHQNKSSLRYLSITCNNCQLQSVEIFIIYVKNIIYKNLYPRRTLYNNLT